MIATSSVATMRTAHTATGDGGTFGTRWRRWRGRRRRAGACPPACARPRAGTGASSIASVPLAVEAERWRRCSAASERSVSSSRLRLREIARSRSRSRVTRSIMRRDASSASSSTSLESSSSRSRATSARSAPSARSDSARTASSSARSRSVSSASATIVLLRLLARRRQAGVDLGVGGALGLDAPLGVLARLVERALALADVALEPRDLLARDGQVRAERLALALQLADEVAEAATSRSPRRPRSP